MDAKKQVRNSIAILFIFVACLSIGTAIIIMKNRKTKIILSQEIKENKLGEEVSLEIFNPAYFDTDDNLEIRMVNYMENKCSQDEDEDTKCDWDKEFVYNLELICKKKKESFSLSSERKKEETVADYKITLVNSKSGTITIKVDKIEEKTEEKQEEKTEEK